jgi:SAM-dependent methyltransferase
MTEKLWVNLGSGDDLKKDYLNVDIFPFDDEENNPNFFCMDLREPWTWALNNMADYILAKDIIEHLPDKIHTMNEAHRVLKSGGIMEIHVPTTDGRGAFQDPTHVSFWNRHSFWYFEKGNPYRERFAASYGITAVFKVVSEHVQETQDGPKLIIILEAVK